MTSLPDVSVEQSLIAGGFSAVISLDEVGRGALAGPVTVGAVVWHNRLAKPPEGIRDSKLVSEKSRDPIVSAIRAWAPCVAVGHAPAGDVDREGIIRALGIAALDAVRQVMSGRIAGDNPAVLLDGAHDWLTPVLPAPLHVVTRVKADRDCLSVAAASLVAKVERDGLMRRLATDFPQYGFDSHKGYGSAKHFEALARWGVSPVHRASFVHLDRLSQSGD